MSYKEEKKAQVHTDDQGHHHSCGCNCGGHSHTHEEAHTPEQKENCGGCCSKQEQEPIIINKEELEILLEMKEYKYLPISEFVMCNSENHHVRFTGLAPVYIKKLDDSMETVKGIATLLKKLEEKGLVSLDYDIPLQGYDYSMHTESELYKYFIETVEGGKDNPDFICDKAEIEFGSAALTALGEKAVESITVE